VQIEVVTIGTELLLGFTIDSNGAEIGRALAAAGVEVVRRTSVADDADAIRDAVAGALARTGLVLTTGGLGPTRDDVSKKVVAGMFDSPFRFDETIWADLTARFARLGRTIGASNRSQAEVPECATVLPNRWGTAPGLWMEGAAGVVIMLPGVPSEMRNLLSHEVVPRLVARAGGAATVIRSASLRTTGIAESALAERLGDIEAAIAPVTLAYLPGVEGVDLRLTAWHLAPGTADAALDRARTVVHERSAGVVYASDDRSLGEVLLDAARTRGLTLALAESCTGGMAAERLTDVPGASTAFLGGVVAYHNQAKQDLLEVPAAMLASEGAVSEAVACAMAEGARHRFGADWAASRTGIAGPGGGSDEKPVGTVWVGISGAAGTSATRLQLFGSRTEIRARAVQSALLRLLQALAGPLP
jgi:nicotinamide-nucleotide amidase